MTTSKNTQVPALANLTSPITQSNIANPQSQIPTQINNTSVGNVKSGYHNRSSLYTNYVNLSNVYEFLPLKNFNLKEFVNSKNFVNTQRCEEHKTSNMDYFCLDCRTPICIHCYNNLHKTHRSIYKVPFIKNPNIDIFNFLEKSVLEFFEKANPDEIKIGIINSINNNHKQLQDLIDEFKKTKIDEVEVLYQKLSNASKDFNTNYINSKKILSTYMKTFESYYPNNYSDLMFLQNFDIVNQALLLKEDSESYLKNLMFVNDNFIQELKQNYSSLLSNLKSLINVVNSNSEIKKISNIQDKFKSFEKVVELNTDYNKQYIKQIELTNAFTDKLDYIPTRIGSTFQISNQSGAKNSIVVGQASLNNSMNNNEINELIKSKSQGEVRSSVAQKSKSSIKNNNYKDINQVTLRKDLKFDIRLFDLGLIHFINTSQIKWEDFISFATNPNDQVLQNKLFIREMQFKNFATPQLLKKIEKENNKETDKSTVMLKALNKTAKSFYNDDDEEIEITPIEGTNCISVLSDKKTYKIEIDLIKVQKEFEEKLDSIKKENLDGNFASISIISPKGNESINNFYTIDNKKEERSSNENKGITFDKNNSAKEKQKKTNNNTKTNITIDTKLNLNTIESKSKKEKEENKDKDTTTTKDEKLVNNKNTITLNNETEVLNKNYGEFVPKTNPNTDAPYSEFPYGVKTLIKGKLVYFVGGKNLQKEFPTIFTYNLKTKETNFVANMIYKRSYCALLLDEEKIYIVGGENNKTCEALCLEKLMCYSLPSLTTPRANSTLYIYKHTLLYCFCGFKSPLCSTDTNNMHDSIERIILRKESVIKIGFHNYYWDKVPYINYTGIDIRLEILFVFPVTDNYLLCYGYSDRQAKKVQIVFDIIKHEVNDLCPEIIKKIKQLLMKSPEIIQMIDDQEELSTIR